MFESAICFLSLSPSKIDTRSISVFEIIERGGSCILIGNLSTDFSHPVLLVVAELIVDFSRVCNGQAPMEILQGY